VKVKELPVVLFLSGAMAATRMLLRFSFGFFPASQARRYGFLRYRLPGSGLDMDAYLPLAVVQAVITAVEVVMAVKTNNDIDTSPRVVNKLYAMVVFAAIAMGRGVGRRTVAVFVDHCLANGQLRARGSDERHTSQSGCQQR